MSVPSSPVAANQLPPAYPYKHKVFCKTFIDPELKSIASINAISVISEIPI